MLLDDLSTITTIQKDTLVKLFKKCEYCISDAIVEQALSGSDIIDVDINIGRILLKLVDGEVKYKFIPYDDFKNIVEASMAGENALSKTVEKTLIAKVTKVYKDLL